MQVSKKGKTCSYFFNFHQTLNILNQKMTFKAYVFPKLESAKGVVS